jgi:phage tail-like protein
MGGFSQAIPHMPSGGVVLGHNFYITLMPSSGSDALLVVESVVTDALLGGFSECSGLDLTLNTEPYKQGGENGYTRNFASRSEWAQITLKRGVGFSKRLWDWSYDFVEGKGKRMDGVIVLTNDLRVPNNIWQFRRGLPVKYSGPSMNANQSVVAIESITIAHEGLYQLPVVPLVGSALNAVAGLAGAAGFSL